MVKYGKIAGVLLFSVLALAIYTFVSFIVGWEYLVSIRGSDTLVYLSHLKVLADYFPNYPFWNPLEGAGVSLTAPYPILTHTVLIIISRLSGLNLVETLKLSGLLSVPLFSLGIYIFSYTRTKNIIVSFIAGLLYVISPIAWIFLFEWGFYAESVAAFLFPITITFFCLYIDTKKKRYVALTALFVALSLLSHGTIATAAVTFIGVYALVIGILEKERLKSIIVGLKAVFIATVLGVLLAGFWFFPFYKYGKIAATGANLGGQIRFDEYERNKLYALEVLSFKLQEDEFVPSYNFRNLSFPKTISILFIAGTILVMFSKKKDHIALGVTVLLLFFATVEVWVTIVLKYIPILDQFASWRSFIYIPRVGVPLLASFAFYYVFYYLFFVIKKYVSIRILLASVFAFFFTLGFLWQFKDQSSYGKEVSMPTRKLGYRDIWKVRSDDPCTVKKIVNEYPLCKSKEFARVFDIPEFLRICERNNIETGLCGSNFTDSEVAHIINDCGAFCPAKYESLKKQLLNQEHYSSKISQFWQNEDFSGPDGVSGYKNIFNKIPEDPFSRYDISVEAVEYSKLSPYFSTTPALPAYINTAWLINRFWGYQVSNFYADDAVYSDPSALSDIAKWFGIRHILFAGEGDTALERFNREGFTKIDDQPIYQVQSDDWNVSISNKPKVLVIGSTSDPVVYDTVFRHANFGIIPYESAMLIKGKEAVDDYSIGELKKYDVLFLYGYSYSNKEKGWKLVDDFIRSGGSVFVDTGWEYQSADWNSGETPAFFPVTNLTWTNYGKADDYRVGGELFETDDIKTSDIEPLVWQDLPWGISGGGSVREWAQPILSVSEGVLIAGGEYGDGRIVWSGMNTLGHIKEFDSQKPENMLMGKIMNYLLRDSSSHILKKDEDFSLKRPNPDRVEVTLHRDIPSGYGLFFKESYFPYWNASNDLEIEYAGPGFMYVDLPEMTQGETIIFSMGIMPAQIWGHIASALGVLGAALYLKGVVKFGFLSKINSPKIGLSNPVKGILDNSEDTDY